MMILQYVIGVKRKIMLGFNGVRNQGIWRATGSKPGLLNFASSVTKPVAASGPVACGCIRFRSNSYNVCLAAIILC